MPDSFGYGALRAVVDADARPEAAGQAVQELDALRVNFTLLDPDQQQLMEPYLRDRARDVLGSRHTRFEHPKQQEQTWADWLGRDATPAELSDFVGAHMRQLHQANRNTNIQQELSGLKRGYADFLVAGVDGGAFAERARHVSGFIPDVRVMFGDVWDTYLQGKSGYHKHGSPDVVIQQPQVAGTNKVTPSWQVERRPLVIHELGHVHFGEWMSPWANEAIDQYVTLQAYHGNSTTRGKMENFRPQPNRSSIDDVYFGGRQLLHLALRGADPALLTRAWSSTGPDSPESHELYNELDKRWDTQYAWEKINGRVNHHTAKIWELSKGKVAYGKLLHDSTMATVWELINSPDVVFVPPTEKPQARLGAAALSGDR